MATVDTLIVKIQADMSQLKRSLNKMERDVSKSTKKAGKSFAQMGMAFRGTIAGVIAYNTGRFTKMLAGMAGDVEEMQAKSSVVFGRFAEDFRGFTKELGVSVGRSRFDLEEMGASVQDLFVPLGFSRGAAAELSKTLVKLAVDVASFNNAQDIDTMRAFQSTLVGNHETVRKFGIVITETEMKAELMRMGITKNTKLVTAQEKVQARLNLIIAGTSDAQGDAAKTSESFTNRSKALVASLKDLSRLIGDSLLPVATDLVNSMIEATVSAERFLKMIGAIAETPEQELERLKNQINDIREALEKLSNVGIPDNHILNRLSGILDSITVAKNIFWLMELTAQFRAAEEAVVDWSRAVEMGGNLIPSFQKPAAAKPIRTPAPTGLDDKQKKALQETVKLYEKQIKQAKDFNMTLMFAVQKRHDITAMLEKENRLVEKNNILQKLGLGQLEDEMEILAANFKFYAEKQKFADADRGKPLSDEERKNAARLKTRFDQLAVQRLAILALGKLIDKRNELIAVQEKSRKINELNQQELNQAASLINSTATAYQRLAYDIAYLEAIIKKFGDTHKKVVQQAQVALEKLRLKQWEMSKEGQVVMQIAGQVVDNVSQNIADVLTNSGEGLKDWKNTLRSILNMIIKEMIKAQLQALLTAKAMQSMMAFFGFGKAPAVGGGVTLSPSYVEGGSKAPVQLAGGGNIQARVPSLVGERGPELFMPNTGGKILNNQETTRALGSGQPVNISQSFNVTTGVAQTVRAEIMSMMPLIEGQTVQAVADAKQRGGAFAQIMSK